SRLVVSNHSAHLLASGHAPATGQHLFAPPVQRHAHLLQRQFRIFPPQAIRTDRHEPQHQKTQDQVPQQTRRASGPRSPLNPPPVSPPGTRAPPSTGGTPPARSDPRTDSRSRGSTSPPPSIRST